MDARRTASRADAGGRRSDRLRCRRPDPKPGCGTSRTRLRASGACRRPIAERRSALQKDLEAAERVAARLTAAIAEGGDHQPLVEALRVQEGRRRENPGLARRCEGSASEEAIGAAPRAREASCRLAPASARQRDAGSPIAGAAHRRETRVRTSRRCLLLSRYRHRSPSARRTGTKRGVPSGIRSFVPARAVREDRRRASEAERAADSG